MSEGPSTTITSKSRWRWNRSASSVRRRPSARSRVLMTTLILTVPSFLAMLLPAPPFPTTLGDTRGRTSTVLPREVARLLGAVSFDQPPGAQRRFVVEMDPPDRIDARQALSYAQRVGDPLGLNEGFHVEIELEVHRGGDRPLGDEQLGMGIARPSQIAIDQL